MSSTQLWRTCIREREREGERKGKKKEEERKRERGGEGERELVCKTLKDPAWYKLPKGWSAYVTGKNQTAPSFSYTDPNHDPASRRTGQTLGGAWGLRLCLQSSPAWS